MHEVLLDTANLSGRDLDAAVVEHVLGWKLIRVGKDYDGQNECEILAPGGEIPAGLQLPPRGKLHRGFLAPTFHSRLDLAIDLAKRDGQQQVDITGDFRELPTLITRAVLEKHLAK